MIQKYAAYLKEVHRTQDRMIPYYLKWVKDAYAHSHTSLKVPITEDAKNAYLLHSSNQREDWQLKQADESIRLYTYFLSIVTCDLRGNQTSGMKIVRFTA